MSQHHARTGHANRSKALRPGIAATLPAPCVECGRAVQPEDRWHVAHILAAVDGGRTTVDNVGPAHADCNMRAGGRRGAAMTGGRAHPHEDSEFRAW